MLHQFSRNELVYGPEGTEILKNSTVAILGIGGVGSFAAEALARTGVGTLILIDKDVVDITNVNRQIHATLKTVGRSKVEVMQSVLQRLIQIVMLFKCICSIMKKLLQDYSNIRLILLLMLQIRLHLKFI